MTFEDCVLECCKNQELVEQFNRLTGKKVLVQFYEKRQPIVQMIDEATGYQRVLDQNSHEDMQAFITFVFEYIWSPLIESEKCLEN